MTKVPLAELHRLLLIVHGVTVSHEEKEEEEVEQEVEERWRENTQGTLRMSMDGMTMEDKCERLEPSEM